MGLACCPNSSWIMWRGLCLRDLGKASGGHQGGECFQHGSRDIPNQKLVLTEPLKSGSKAMEVNWRKAFHDLGKS